jgi:hypothetical protein
MQSVTTSLEPLHKPLIFNHLHIWHGTYRSEDRFHPAHRLRQCRYRRRKGLRQEVRHQDHSASKEASWAGVRDKLMNGELHAAHVLYGLVYGVQLGIGGQQKDMAVLMSLNNNGQAITLSNQLREKGVKDGASLKKEILANPREYTFAQTFPTGTHAMWLYYWLAATYGVHPFKDVKTIRGAATADGRQHARRQHGRLLRGRALERARHLRQHRFHRHATTQDIWTDHPEKVLGCTAEFCQKYPNTARAMTMAVLERVALHRRHEKPRRRGQADFRQGLRQCTGRRNPRPLHGRLRQRHRQEVEGPELHEVLLTTGR